MRVDPTGSQLPPIRTAAGSPARPTPKTGDGPTEAADAGGFTPTNELTGLLAAVREAPEVRADVIESMAGRLASGEFATPEAAAGAAAALLDSGHLGD